jgi:hypothetical protein
MFLPFLSFGDVVDNRQWEVQACMLDFVLEPVVDVELSKKIFTSRVR